MSIQQEPEELKKMTKRQELRLMHKMRMQVVSPAGPGPQQDGWSGARSLARRAWRWTLHQGRMRCNQKALFQGQRCWLASV